MASIIALAWRFAGLAWGSKWARIVTACLVGLTAIKGYGYYHQTRGAEKVIQKSIQQGKAANNASAKIRQATSKPGAFERLLRDSCRDC